MRILFAALLAWALTLSVAYSEPIAVAAWNVEDFDFGGHDGSSGSDGAEIAVQLRDDFNAIDIIALSEVHTENVVDVYASIASLDEDVDYNYAFGTTGNSIRLALLINTTRFATLSVQELDFGLDPNGTRFPLVAELKSKATGQEFFAVATHFARGSEQNRITQSRKLREWASAQTIPVIALGDFNFDYNINTDRRHPAYDELVKDDVFKWAEPKTRIDTSWSGQDSDRFPNQILDFIFTSGEAQDWQHLSVVYERPRDFPDNGDLADHRPVVSFFETDPNVALNVDLTQSLPRLIQPQQRFRRTSPMVPQMQQVQTSTPQPAIADLDIEPEATSAAPAAQAYQWDPNALVADPDDLPKFDPRIWPWIKPGSNQPVVVMPIDQLRNLGKVRQPGDLTGIPKHLWPIVSGNPNLPSNTITADQLRGILGKLAPGADPNDFPPELLPFIRPQRPFVLDGYDGR